VLETITFTRGSLPQFSKRVEPWRGVRLLVVPFSVVRASPTPPAKHAPFRWAALLFLEPVPLGAKVADLRHHPLQQKLSRRSRYVGALKLQDLLTLPSDLDAHALDFGTDVI
jgi:hypothetical protein